MENPTRKEAEPTCNEEDINKKSYDVQKNSSHYAMSDIQKSSIAKHSSYLYTLRCDNLCSVDINSKNNLLACGFENSSIHVWNLKSLKSKQVKEKSCDQNLDKSTESLSSEVVNDRNSLLGSNKDLKGHHGTVYGLSFSSPHSLLLSCSEDSSVRAWSTENFNTVAVYGDQRYPIFDITLSSNGAYFATASMDFSARLWSFERSQPLRIFAGHASSVSNVKFHSNSKYIATTSDKVIQLWTVEDGRSVRNFLGHKSYISSIAFSPSGQHLASADEKGCIKIWDLGLGKEIGEISGHTCGILSIAYNKNSSFIASGGFDKVLKVWDVKHSINNKTFSTDTSKLGNKEDCYTTELVDSHETESTLHFVSFRKKDLLLSVATSVSDC